MVDGRRPYRTISRPTKDSWRSGEQAARRAKPISQPLRSVAAADNSTWPAGM